MKKILSLMLVCGLLIGLCPVNGQAKIKSKNYWMLLQGGDYRNEAEPALGTVDKVTIAGNKVILKGKGMNSFKSNTFNNTKEYGRANKLTLKLHPKCKYYISVYDEEGMDAKTKVSKSAFKKSLKAPISMSKMHGGKNQPDGFLRVHVKKGKVVELSSIAGNE